MSDQNDSSKVGESGLLDSAETALREGQWARGFGLLNSSELASISDAQNLLAWLYFSGKGIAKNPDKAIACLQKAIDLGSWPAKCNLARAYQLGIGVKKDRVIAFNLYRQADKMPAAPFLEDPQFQHHDADATPTSKVLDECWSRCQDREFRLHRDLLLTEPNSPRTLRERRTVGITGKYANEQTLLNPVSWLISILTLLCHATLNAIIIENWTMPGYAFLGTMHDAIRLGLIFCIVNFLVTCFSMIALPLYVIGLALLIYFGCDLPIIGALLSPIILAIGNRCSKFMQAGRKADETVPLPTPEKLIPSARTITIMGFFLTLICNIISARIVTDVFPSVFSIHGWIATFIFAVLLATSNYVLGRLLFLPLYRTMLEEVFLTAWIF
jgi:hypothetical protein